MKPGFVLKCLVLSAVAAALVQPATVHAQRPEPGITIGFVDEAVAGEPIAVSAYLIDPAGNPIYDAEIDFSVAAEFMNVSTEVEIGIAITDRSGLAVVLFEPRTEGPNTLTASYAGSDVFEAVSDTADLAVTGNGQLYRELPPFRFPGANVWLPTAMLSTIWLVFSIALGLIAWGNYRARKAGRKLDV